MKTDNKMKQRLLKAFRNDLPGERSHIKMIPESRLNISFNHDTESIKKSAVLLLLFPENETYKLVFIKRAEDGSKHSGQIAFPGGKAEHEDNGLSGTALRETEEEIGVNRNKITIVKALTSLFIPVSKFSVSPFVGITDTKPEIIMNTDEVQNVFSPDIRELAKAERIDKTINVRGQKIIAPFYVFDEFEIWGASAMILSEFIDLIKTEFVN